MTLLFFGLILWMAAHFFKRVMPGLRARLGDRGKGLIALAIVAALVMIILGYRDAREIYVWSPPYWGIHLTDLFMLFSVVLFGVGSSKSRLRTEVRHPMLAGVRVWAGAHLLVNGDLASIMLFATMFLWASAEVLMINRAEPDWQKPEPGNLAGDIRLVVISVALYAVISAVHYWLGYPVFPG